MTETLTFFHAPHTRSGGTAFLLAELDAPHELHVVDLKAGEQRRPEYLAVNPLGKVPAIRHGDALVSEQVAIFAYLPDLFPTAGLAPPIGDPKRGPYLRWLALYGSCFEPAVVDKAMKREPAPPAMSPYGTFDLVFDTLTAQLRAGPYLLGEQMSAADILWGTGLGWTTRFGLVPTPPEVLAYVERITSRPAWKAVEARDEELAAVHAAARRET